MQYINFICTSWTPLYSYIYVIPSLYGDWNIVHYYCILRFEIIYFFVEKKYGMRNLKSPKWEIVRTETYFDEKKIPRTEGPIIVTAQPHLNHNPNLNTTKSWVRHSNHQKTTTNSNYMKE